MRPGCFRLQCKQRNGRWKSKRVHGTRADAEQAAAAWRRELDATIADLSPHTPLGDCIRRMLALDNRAPGTIAWHDRMLRLYIEPRRPRTKIEQAFWRRRFADSSYDFSLGRKPVGRIRMQDGMDLQ